MLWHFTQERNVNEVLLGERKLRKCYAQASNGLLSQHMGCDKKLKINNFVNLKKVQMILYDIVWGDNRNCNLKPCY